MTATWGTFRGTDRFEIQRRLGEGGFGVVYEVLDRERQEMVALKTLHRLDPEALYRFKKEFRTLADVSSPHLVSLRELFAEGDLWFFTMELIRGVSFLDFVEARETPEDSVDEQARTQPFKPRGDRPPRADEATLRWALGELADSVAALHRLGWLHRDLKPGNVMVSDQRQVKLLDFGLLAEAGAERSTADQIVGTLAYMAPEQARGQAGLGQAVDWYAVGVMLYEALTGRLPHEGGLYEVLAAKSEVDPLAPRELVADAPRDLSDLAMALLHRDPARRAGLDAIKAVLGEASAPPVAPALEEATLLGRQTELARLEEALGAVRSGWPVLMEVRGRSGMGKSALVERFLGGLAHRPEAVVLEGRCYEQEAVPYKALDSVVDSLSRYLHGLDRARAGDLMPRDVRALSRLFPVLDRVAAVREAPEIAAAVPDPQELRLRAFAALGELLGRIGDRHRLVLAIDDLQWGDVDSALALSNLLTAADPPAMLLVLTYRSEERGRSPFLRELLGRTALRAETRAVEVERLEEGAARELTRQLLGPPAPRALVRAILAEAEGCPFFIQVLARTAKTAEGRVTLEGAISRLVQPLPEGSRRLLELIALSSQPLSTATALEAADLGVEGRRALEGLKANHLLRSCGGSRDLVECYHDRIRELLEAELEPPALTGRHRALARALEASGEADAERLTRHLEGAGELQAAALQAERAARLADDKLAFEQAARLYRKALLLGDHDPERAQALRVELADALANAGLGWEAAPEYLAAAEGMERLERLELQRRAALQLLATGHFDQGCRVLERVLAELGMKLESTPRRALLSVMFQRALLTARGQDFQLREDGEELPAEEGLRIDTCWAVFGGFKGTDLTRVGGFGARYLRLALNSGDPRRISLGLSSEAAEKIVLRPTSRRARRRAAEALEQARQLALEVGDPAVIAFNHQAAGLAAFYYCRFPEALERSKEAIAIYRDQCRGMGHEIVHAEMHVISALFYLGRLEELRRRVPGRLQEARARGDISAELFFLGGYGFLAWLASDDVETTVRELERARASWKVEDFLLQNYLLLLAEQLTDLYRGRGLSAWERLTEHWRVIERSVWLLLPLQRAKWLHVRGASALAAAIEGSVERGTLLGEAKRCARGLAKVGLPYASGHGHLIRAGLAQTEGDLSRVGVELCAAEQAFASLGMVVHESIARRCRGVSRGGEEGRALVEPAEALIRRQGATRPERLAAMLAPGFDQGPSSGGLDPESDQ